MPPRDHAPEEREVRAALLRKVTRTPSTTNAEKVYDQLAFMRGFTEYDSAQGRHDLTEAGRAFLAAGSVTDAAFCRHCAERRKLEVTIEALGRTAANALAIDTSTRAGENAYEFAVAQVLGTLAELVEGPAPRHALRCPEAAE